MVTIVHGADNESAELAGRSIREVRAAYESVFNIPGNALAKVNNQEVSEDRIVSDGDKIVFDKPDDKFTTAVR